MNDQAVEQAAEKLPATAENVVEVLTGTSLVQSWADSLENSGLAMDQQVTLKKWASEFRDQIVAQVKDIEFEESVETVIALRYIEIRSAWNGLNTQLQFQMFKGKTNDMPLMVRMSLMSAIIAELERFIRSEDKDQVDTFLDNPMINQLSGLIKVDSNKVTIFGPNRILIQKQ